MEPLLAAALVFCNPGQPGPYSSASAVVDAYAQAYNRGAGSGVAALLARDAVIIRGAQRLSGEELATSFQQQEGNADAAFRVTVRDRQARDNLVAQTESYVLDGSAPQVILTVYEVKGGCIVRILASSPGDFGIE